MPHNNEECHCHGRGLTTYYGFSVGPLDVESTLGSSGELPNRGGGMLHLDRERLDRERLSRMMARPGNRGSGEGSYRNPLVESG